MAKVVSQTRPRTLVGDPGPTTGDARRAVLRAPAPVFVRPRLISNGRDEVAIMLRDLTKAGKLVKAGRGIYYKPAAGETPPEADVRKVLAGDTEYVDFDGNAVAVAEEEQNPILSTKLTKEFLEAEYVTKKRTAASIAKEVGVTSDTVLRACRRHRIEVRRRGPMTPAAQELSKEQLETMYVSSGMEPGEIAGVLDRSPRTVVRALKAHGIPIRPAGFLSVLTREYLEEYYVKKGLTTTEIGRLVGCSDTTVANALQRFGIERLGSAERRDYGSKLTKEFLQKEYVENGRSQSEIAGLVGCNRHTVAKYLALHDVTRPDADAADADGAAG